MTRHPVRALLLALLVLSIACSRALIESSAPGPRSGHNLVHDAAGDRTLLLFGYSGSTSPARSEIWSWNGDSWSIADRSGPGFRSLAGVAMDDAHGTLIIFGGAGPGYQTRYGDTWTWARGEWTQRVVRGPGPTDHHAVAYDQRRRALISFGGNDPTGGWHVATWALDSTDWRIAADSLVSPPARAHHAMTYDSRRGRIVLFGGLARDRGYLADTWEWDGSGWHRIEVAGPPARTRHRLAYDATRGVVVMYGGSGVRPPGQTSGFNALADLWEYDGRAWRRIDTGDGPGPRFMHAMTWDARRGETLLFGGSDGTADRSDLWAWDGVAWRRKS